MWSDKMTEKRLNAAEAADWVRNGGVLAYPTEAVYGLGCDPFNETAFQRLLALKSRPLEKGVILIASQVEQVADLAELYECPWSESVLQSWREDSAVTWVLPAKMTVPSWVTGGRKTVAIRVTRHPQVQALCDALGGPLVSTSANVSGADPIRTEADCLAAFPEVPVLIGQVSGAATPSEIWEAETGRRLR
jgi:translation factor SUA5